MWELLRSELKRINEQTGWGTERGHETTSKVSLNESGSEIVSSLVI